MPFAAAVNMNSREYIQGHLLGQLASGILCGLWPLVVGFRNDRPIVGVIGFVACIPCGFLFGCFSALPVAFVLKSLIGAMGRPNPPGGEEFPGAPLNPYAGGKRSAF